MRNALFVLVIGALLAAPPAAAKCAPKNVLKIVTTADGPGLPKDHFARRPKTLYRSGETMGRLEEERNSESGLHLLIVVNEPDIWIVNRADMTGQHAVDSGPTYVFHAPILDNLESKYWNNFELGCELPFMKAVGAEPREIDGTKNRLYEHTAEGITARLIVNESGIPVRVEIDRPGERFAINYVAFEEVKDPPATLFQRPEGVKYRKDE